MADDNIVIIEEVLSLTVQTAVGATGPTGPTGPTGATGATGASGVIAVTAPITNSGTSTSANIGINQTGITIAQSQVTSLVTDLANKVASTELTGVRPVSSSGWMIPAPAPVSTNNAFLPTVGQMFAVPFFVSKAVTVTSITCNVTTAGTGTSTARLGIYDTSTSTLEPSALVADAGTVTCDTTGIKTISSLSISLVRGTYWAVVALNSATVAPQFRGHFDVSVGGIWQTNLNASNGVSSLQSSSSVTGSLPSTFSVSSSQFSNRRCPQLQIGLS